MSPTGFCVYLASAGTADTLSAEDEPACQPWPDPKGVHPPEGSCVEVVFGQSSFKIEDLRQVDDC